ncbi:hypothetical protein NO559_01930 [Dasania sp. GY-MA-18]|uniref:Zinc resistance-associated protein n=1 Tax=Dasania phycosphaerae TaxID=2950436 RepID=A0A9J6RHU4_9GAMM|nr:MULTISPECIES: hypothetical protein [Dasania]MCR8921510.1 hypothetical protein [Dasania sp. GY-MA-18]MCZ0863938.1 hypothetical protein [Dasania phycosphaerae]MCZ0867666.1 hypothetical protein [Dasania phycosphaerae]
MKQLITFIAIAVLSLPSYAHSDRNPEQHMDKLAKRLELNEQQQQQVAAILKQSHEQHKALKESTHEQLSNVLSAEQLEKMEKMHDKRRHKHKRDKD